MPAYFLKHHLVIYKKNKKTLKFDLAVIGFLQVVALLYGLHSLLISKPAWIVFNLSST